MEKLKSMNDQLLSEKTLEANDLKAENHKLMNRLQEVQQTYLEEKQFFGI